ncbi:hypothetical protein EOD42_11950 [Rhodovarius crocodyli]|uniref:DUF1468 domain-containing protein n=1 Tax=Rhodovarius crocodyli TaxID=1979269 RepID=A0A437MHI2_9PROT|nr:tripartite tricarboxylate transporter TctB family protein [Rhodovarius crocodyli]RVT97096.1 hypothetical protein EOD42_11950 [Rhodovarius crocodyli]
MKINQRDIASGVFFIVLAAIGLWLNTEHTMGSARRMGPGYMPWLVFWLQIALGVGVVLVGTASGPEKMDRWKADEIGTFIGGIVAGFAAWWLLHSLGGYFAIGYNSLGCGILVGFLVLSIAPGWRFLGMIMVSMAIFALLLEQFGFFAALIGLIVASCLPEREHTSKPLGVLLCTLFLLALCWFVFIYELDIRVNLWPTG